jgi:hypothetical protein
MDYDKLEREVNLYVKLAQNAGAGGAGSVGDVASTRASELIKRIEQVKQAAGVFLPQLQKAYDILFNLRENKPNDPVVDSWQKHVYFIGKHIDAVVKSTGSFPKAGPEVSLAFRFFDSQPRPPKPFNNAQWQNLKAWFNQGGYAEQINNP